MPGFLTDQPADSLRNPPRLIKAKLKVNHLFSNSSRRYLFITFRSGVTLKCLFTNKLFSTG